MKVIFNTGNMDAENATISSMPVGIGLGNFDGLHVGHMTLIEALIKECRENGLYSMIYTFTKHPENILRKKLFTPLLTTALKKIELLSQTGLDYIYFDEFDEDFSRMKPDEFVKKVLIDRFGIKIAVAGFDYRFGYRGQGDAALLEELGREHGFKVIVIPPVKVDDEVVSSTLIRSCIAKGDLEKAFRLLGRHYSITGRVVEGRHIGTTLGFPTANIEPEEHVVIPHKGVYITKTLVDGIILNSVTNVGLNPTAGRLDKTAIETHILDFSGDLYGKNIEVFFIARIRDEKKFRGVEELVRQIKKDVLTARERLRGYGENTL